MEIILDPIALKQYVHNVKQEQKKVGFVPTMGALHEGHLTLIQEAQKKTDIVICSIFVNPTQFNDPKDLEKYPRPIEQDKALLNQIGCDVLFLPDVSAMYPPNEPEWSIDLGNLDRIWEGEHRPGHFQGVTQVVYKLFQLVQPDVAFFGQKDFQQVMVIQRMVEVKKLPVQLDIVPTKRNEYGLALSSRNTRLSPEGIEHAYALPRALNRIQQQFKSVDLQHLTPEAIQTIEQTSPLKVEYLAICEAKTLALATMIEDDKDYVVIAAAWIEGVRLIDNVILTASKQTFQ
ncbi:pantoate--beta-alanine ligase [Sphingobacterium corticis]|uniref:Pantothenate synthetase n=1 Tax=Sphingobacterium corticis TaxID=1812823 RepID=A0ABW5NGE1_9SPHI